MYVRTLFGPDWNFLHVHDDVIFFIAFLSSPHRETPKNALKKNRQGGKKLDARPRKTFLSRFWVPLTERRLTNATKKIERKKSWKIPQKKNHPPKKIFPRCFFLTRTQFFSRVFELPLPRNAQKRTKNFLKNKEGTYVLFLASWRRCTSFSRFIFSVAPWVRGDFVTRNQNKSTSIEQCGELKQLCFRRCCTPWGGEKNRKARNGCRRQKIWAKHE